MARMKDLRINDPAMYAVLKSKKDAKRNAKKEALAKILAYVIAKGDPEIQRIAKSLTLRAPTQRTAGAPSFMEIFKKLFAASKTCNEEQVFKDFRLGRAEMRKNMVKAIKSVEPAQRLWIKFSPDTGTYTLVATGPEAPAGWTGYRPLVVDGAEVK
jgi:tRNA G10  N-methylase Trm11